MVGSAQHSIKKKLITFSLCSTCFDRIWINFKQLIDIYRGIRTNQKGERSKKNTVFRSFSMENRAT